MPRKPNYQFERRERERIKAAKAAQKAAAKAEERPHDPVARDGLDPAPTTKA